MSFWTGVRLPPAPLIFIRRDPPKVGGILMKHADACEWSSLFNASAPLIFIRRDPPKVGGILVKHADACERSSPFNASAPLVLKVGCKSRQTRCLETRLALCIGKKRYASVMPKVVSMTLRELIKTFYVELPSYHSPRRCKWCIY